MIPAEPFISMSSKRVRKKKKVEIEVASPKKKKKGNTIKLQKRKKAIVLPNVEAVVSQHLSSTLNMNDNSSLSMILYRFVRELLKNAFKNHLKLKLSGSSTMTPVINIPVSVHSSELLSCCLC